MDGIKLTYFFVTYNRLPQLKEAVRRLLENIGPDEELVVADGASSDGTREYLEELRRAGKIHQFVSEPDKGESHGLNKCLLMARGELLKLVTDDDAFYYPNIRKCKQFMLEHPEYDLLGADGVSVSWTRPDHFRRSHYYQFYEKWREEGKPFDFSGLGLMIRRGSLPLLGLFHTSFTRIDAEYSLRATAGKALLAWYTGATWARILNPQESALSTRRRQELEAKKLNYFYSDLRPGTRVEIERRNVTEAVKLWLWRIKKRFMPRKDKLLVADAAPKDVSDEFQRCDRWLEENNSREPGRFL